MDKIYVRTCLVCGELFETNESRRKICSEGCYNTRKISYRQRSYINQKINMRNTVEKQERERLFNEKLKRAKEENLTYGKYVAKIYLETHETIKERLERERDGKKIRDNDEGE